MPLKRLCTHLLSTHWRLNRDFPPATLNAIEAAIGASERRCGAQLRFAVEAALETRRLWRDQSSRERALEVFAGLRMSDTDQRNGVLIYLLLADRSVEIVVDRGAHAVVEAQVWVQICRNMEQAFRAGRYREGVLEGIEAVTVALQGPFPPGASTRSLPDTPVVL